MNIVTASDLKGIDEKENIQNIFSPQYFPKVYNLKNTSNFASYYSP
jgi:hypothetical protein